MRGSSATRALWSTASAGMRAMPMASAVLRRVQQLGAEDVREVLHAWHDAQLTGELAGGDAAGGRNAGEAIAARVCK